MTGIIIFIVAILGIIAILQLAKVFELSAVLSGKREEHIADKDNKTQAYLFLLFMIALFGSYFWLIYEYGDKMLPSPASAHGEEYDMLMNVNLIVVNIVFIAVNFLLFFFAFKYYFNKNRKALYFTHSNKLEMIWTIIPSIFLAVIIVWGLKTWNSVMIADAPEDAVVIELYAKQFDWTARYAGKDNALGDAHVRFIKDANFVGLNPEDVKGKDDKVIKGEFHIPVGKSIKFMLRSQDVIHSAYMPHFRSQMNVVPGLSTSMFFTPTKTTQEMRAELGNDDFNYVLLCNKICGSSHYNMQMDIIVESEEDYNNWLAEQPTFTY